MSLFSNILTPVVTNITNPGNNSNGKANGAENGNSAKAPGQTEKAEEPAVTVTAPPVAVSVEVVPPTSEKVVKAEQAQAGNNAAATHRHRSEAASEDEKVIAAVLAEPEEREDEVIAVDFVRRAAIAAQAKAKSESLLDGLAEDPFAPLSVHRSDSLSAYGQTEQSRFGATMDKRA